MSVCIVTPTRDRNLVIHLLARWLRQQTVKPDRWIVVDDGETPIEFEPPMTHLVRRLRGKNEPVHSLCLNLRQALPYLVGDHFFICEDDEYYAPTYIETMLSHFNEWPPQGPQNIAVGIGYSKYYHLGLKSPFVHENMRHASLAQTAFSAAGIVEFIRALEDPNEKFIDIRFWKRVLSRGIVWRDGEHFDGKAGAQYVGMKGLPGLPGIGFGHKAMPQYRQDPKLEYLRRWIRPEDFAEYEKIGREHLWTKGAH